MKSLFKVTSATIGANTTHMGPTKSSREAACKSGSKQQSRTVTLRLIGAVMYLQMTRDITFLDKRGKNQRAWFVLAFLMHTKTCRSSIPRLKVKMGRHLHKRKTITSQDLHSKHIPGIQSDRKHRLKVSLNLKQTGNSTRNNLFVTRRVFSHG